MSSPWTPSKPKPRQWGNSLNILSSEVTHPSSVSEKPHPVADISSLILSNITFLFASLDIVAHLLNQWSRFTDSLKRDNHPFSPLKIAADSLPTNDHLLSSTTTNHHSTYPKVVPGSSDLKQGSWRKCRLTFRLKQTQQRAGASIRSGTVIKILLILK